MLETGATVDSLTRRFALGQAIVVSILEDLSKMGLITGTGGVWRATGKNIHLPAKHRLAPYGHIGWREHVIAELRRRSRPGLHYSAVHCLTHDDVERVHQLLKDAVLKARTIIDESPAKRLAVMCLDWFEV